MYVSGSSSFSAGDCSISRTFDAIISSSFSAEILLASILSASFLLMDFNGSSLDFAL